MTRSDISRTTQVKHPVRRSDDWAEEKECGGPPDAHPPAETSIAQRVGYESERNRGNDDDAQQNDDDEVAVAQTRESAKIARNADVACSAQWI